MRIILVCLGILVLSQVTNAATTYHVYQGAPNVSPNYDTLSAALTELNLGTGGDTISIDDSTTYTVASGATLQLNQPNTSIVAAAGQTPVIQLQLASGSTSPYPVQIKRPGCRIGSATGGKIIIDGNRSCRRGIYLYNDTTTWLAASTITLQNLIFRNFPQNLNSSTAYIIVCFVDGDVTPLPAGTSVFMEGIDFQFLSAKPATAISAGSHLAAVRFNGDGATLNMENCRSNTLCGYVVSASNEGTARTTAWGTINLKNCRFVYDDPISINYKQMGSPVALWGASSVAHANGYTLNIDNCYLRSDANYNGIWSPSQVSPSPTAGSADTSESLGVITLLNYKKNDVTITNSAIVGAGSGININSAHAAVRVTNSDILVNKAAHYTPGYFISVAPRAIVAVSADIQCTATQCNLYGLQGSRINSGPRGAGSVFTMISCNDWSAADAYASNWVTSTCVNGGIPGTPGQNPNYGGNADPTGALAVYDMRASNTALTSLNIGSNRLFNLPVPVELSTFSLQ